MGSARHCINQSPLDKHYQKPLSYLWIVVYPMDNVIHPLDNWDQKTKRYLLGKKEKKITVLKQLPYLRNCFLSATDWHLLITGSNNIEPTIFYFFCFALQTV